MFSKDYRSYKT